jgi:hypothetical protein
VLELHNDILGSLELISDTFCNDDISVLTALALTRRETSEAGRFARQVFNGTRTTSAVADGFLLGAI